MILLYLKIFWTFFKIGLFGFGGGYAMISMIQAEVVSNHGWMTNGEFTDIVAISQSTPGPIGINSATYVGYTSVVNAGYSSLWGALGSLIATFAVVLPSLILMLAISRFFMKYKNHPAVEHTFMGLRPAVVGLLAAAALLLMNAENFSAPGENPWQFFISVGLFLFAFIGQMVYKMNPVLLLVLCGITGLLLF
ncbi:MAG: chromate transporter [Bacteroidaceae bacterium]|nr:chromate transporter [Bacteroidaceae bacterium]